MLPARVARTDGKNSERKSKAMVKLEARDPSSTEANVLEMYTERA